MTYVFDEMVPEAVVALCDERAWREGRAVRLDPATCACPSCGAALYLSAKDHEEMKGYATGQAQFAMPATDECCAACPSCGQKLDVVAEAFIGARFHVRRREG